jgi:hypothetical protein
MRADARRNQERLLDAAIEPILEVGAEPPLDAIADRDLDLCIDGLGSGTHRRTPLADLPALNRSNPGDFPRTYSS